MKENIYTELFFISILTVMVFYCSGMFDEPKKEPTPFEKGYRLEPMEPIFGQPVKII